VCLPHFRKSGQVVDKFKRNTVMCTASMAISKAYFLWWGKESIKKNTGSSKMVDQVSRPNNLYEKRVITKHYATLVFCFTYNINLGFSLRKRDFL